MGNNHPINTGHPWGDFLLARKIMIDVMVEEGKSFDVIARDLSMDPVQARLIASAPIELIDPPRIEEEIERH